MSSYLLPDRLKAMLAFSFLLRGAWGRYTPRGAVKDVKLEVTAAIDLG